MCGGMSLDRHVANLDVGERTDLAELFDGLPVLLCGCMSLSTLQARFFYDSWRSVPPVPFYFYFFGFPFLFYPRCVHSRRPLHLRYRPLAPFRLHNGMVTKQRFFPSWFIVMLAGWECLSTNHSFVRFVKTGGVLMFCVRWSVCWSML